MQTPTAKKIGNPQGQTGGREEEKLDTPIDTTMCHSGQEILDAAHEYVDNGWSVIPVRRSNKRPYLASWREYQQRLPTHEEIEGWWKQWPDANVAIVTGTISGIWVGDADGPRGVDYINEKFPKTSVYSITYKGFHAVYALPKGAIVKTAVRIAPDVDIRGEGGYIVAPPSLHAMGHEYRWQFLLDGWDDLTEFVPSINDRSMFNRLNEVGKLIGIECVDHIVFGDHKHYSVGDSTLWPMLRRTQKVRASLPKVHYNMALNPDEFKVPACSAKSERVTTDKEKVTCRRCLGSIKAERAKRRKIAMQNNEAARAVSMNSSG